LNLAYRWFCRLGLDGAVPDHSTFSKNRHGRFRDSDVLRRLFETVLQRCIDASLVGGEGFAIDASLIQADASDRNRVEGAAGLPTSAAGRAVEEYLATLDDAAFGAASEVTPKFIAPTDPATRWTAAHRGPAFFAYSNNYLIDVDNAIIVDVEATTAIRQAEIRAAKRMIERSMERFDLYPARLIGDSAYGSAEMLNWLAHDRGIGPTSQCSTNPSALTVRSLARTSTTITPVTLTAARPAKPSGNTDDDLRRHVPVCQTTI
jgi:IS5 family transposase